jgi:hypothetical protein
VVGVPDGANTADTGTADQDPGTPGDQINAEIARENVLGWWRSLFGMEADQPYQAGGGGQGGQFMFASIHELDGVIKKWEDERDGIQADCNAISEAYYAIRDPAADSMSVEVAGASKNSLANMWSHSNSMLTYANNYIEKLKASRKQMQTMEHGAHSTINSVQA